MVEYKEGDRVRLLSVRAIQGRAKGTLDPRVWEPKHRSISGLPEETYRAILEKHGGFAKLESGLRTAAITLVGYDVCGWHLSPACLWPADDPLYPGAEAIYDGEYCQAIMPLYESEHARGRKILSEYWVIFTPLRPGSHGHGEPYWWAAPGDEISPPTGLVQSLPVVVESRKAAGPRVCPHDSFRVIAYGRLTGRFARCLTPGCGQLYEDISADAWATKTSGLLKRGPDTDSGIREMGVGRPSTLASRVSPDTCLLVVDAENPSSWSHLDAVDEEELRWSRSG